MHAYVHFIEYIVENAHLSFLIIPPQPITSDDHLIIQGSGHILQIKATQISDTGRYGCVASNIAGEDELEFDVNIQGIALTIYGCIYKDQSSPTW